MIISSVWTEDELTLSPSLIHEKIKHIAVIINVEEQQSALLPLLFVTAMCYVAHIPPPSDDQSMEMHLRSTSIPLIVIETWRRVLSMCCPRPPPRSLRYLL